MMLTKHSGGIELPGKSVSIQKGNYLTTKSGEAGLNKNFTSTSLDFFITEEEVEGRT